MSVDAMTRLAHANPVLDPPVVESPERLRRLIEDDAPMPISASSAMRTRRWARAHGCVAARLSPFPSASLRAWSASCSARALPVRE